MRPWYEILVEQSGQIRSIEVRGNLEGAKRVIEQLKVGWPKFDMIFVRQHRKSIGQPSTFRVLHKLTVRGGR